MRYARNAESISFTEEASMIYDGKTEKFIRLRAYGMGPVAMKKIKICPRCGHIAKRISLICPTCKKILTHKTLFDKYKMMHFCCPFCDIPLTGDTLYCPHCGRKVGLKPGD